MFGTFNSFLINCRLNKDVLCVDLSQEMLYHSRHKRTFESQLEYPVEPVLTGLKTLWHDTDNAKVRNFLCLDFLSF